MIKPLIPINEAARLQALAEYNILDTPPENDFDGLTQLAAQICGTPVSVISFIDPKRQWFKSHYGLAKTEGAREFAFCAHAINNPYEVFVVPDSRKDERFADNPLVCDDPNVIFYAGMPLVSPQGYAIGTLCIIDHKPGNLTQEQENALKIISNQVVKLLELRKKNVELDDNKKQLEKSMELFAQTGDVARVGGWEVNMKTNSLSWTAMTKEIHELPQDAAPDLHAAIEFYKPGKCRDIITKLIIDAVENGKHFDTELQIVTAKNNVKWVRAKGIPDFKNGKCIRLYGIIQDIDKEKKKELKLAQSEEQFRQTFSHASIGMALVAPNGRWIKVNESICQMIGYQEEELLQTTFQQLTHPTDLAKDLAMLQDLVDGKIKSYEIEKRYLHKEGHVIWVILSVSLVRDEKNRPVHFISQITDITKRKEAEQIVKDERRLLVTLIDNLPLNVFVKDLDSRKVLVNQKEIDYLGASCESDILGKNDYELYPEETALISIKEDQQVFATGESIINKETSSTTNAGTQAWFLTSKIPLLNASNQMTGLLGISYDISERKKTEKKLKQLLDVTAGQNVKLLNFAHIVSHNLRSHSSNFALLLDFLETEQDEQQKQQLFGMLKQASGNLVETVAHLNDIVAVNSETKEVADINLAEAIQKVQFNIKAQLLESQVQVMNEVDTTFSISAVPAYLDSILLNFITNGIKYKSDGKIPFIKFNASRHNEQLLLTIQDNGLGIDMDKNREKLFGMYKTFHGNKDARGVGLFITKNQVEAMGGTIDVESKVGEGTTFKILFNLN